MIKESVQPLGSNTRSFQFLMEYEGANILKRFGLPIALSGLATSKEEAIEIANETGYPVVLKGMSKDIVHKTEADIVRLNIQNNHELIQYYDEILKNASNYNNCADIAGVYVQKMSAKGIEIIFGIKKDPVFGHQLIIGMGGILVEILKDFSMRMMPVTSDDVKEMISELKSSALIQGYRGQRGVNVQEIVQICLSLNKLIEKFPELEELDLNPVIFSDKEVVICDVRMLLCEKELKNEESNAVESLHSMINPSSIAVIGASTDERKNGGRLFRFIVENGYEGDLYPINPSALTIKGYKAYPSIKEVPNEIDLACIIVDAKQVTKILGECVEKKVKSAIIYSSGFAEIGEEGVRLQEEINLIAKQGNIRLLGPNSIGIASPAKNIYTAFGNALESKVKIPGSIGFISQSGAMGSALLSRAWEQGVGFSRWISVANEADLTTADFISVLAEDELTKVISIFMEGVKDAKTLEKAAQKALEYKKPVLVYKTGKSTVGKRAVQSHTGSIAGDDAVFSAAFKKYNMLRIERLDELIDVSRAFTVHSLPKGKRIGILTASGGACSVLADLCSSKGLEVPELTKTSELIFEMIPSFGSASNPVDVTAEIIAKPEMFKRVLELLVCDEEIDGVIVMLTTNADPGATIIAQSIIDVIKNQEKTILVGRLGADGIAPNAMALYSQENVPVYPTPEKVVSVMNYLVKYNEILKKNKN